MNELRDRLFKELMKGGYSMSNGRKVWNVANRSLLYFTDELAKNFLEFRNFPRYREVFIDIEIALLKENAKRFLAELGDKPFNLIDIGCVDGIKAKTLIEEFCGDCKLRYCPVHINKYLVDLALTNVKSANFSSIADYKSYIADLEDIEVVSNFMRNSEYQKNAFLLLDSILASFEIHEYLFKLSRSMLSGDILVIGNSIRTGERFSNLEVYKHAVFDEWFKPLIKGIGFEDEEVQYDARFANGRVEGFYKIMKAKVVEYGGKKFEFNAGDEIVVAILYKYYDHELKEYCRMYFRDVEIFIDSNSEYALVLCKK